MSKPKILVFGDHSLLVSSILSISMAPSYRKHGGSGPHGYGRNRVRGISTGYKACITITTSSGEFCSYYNSDEDAKTARDALMKEWNG